MHDFARSARQQKQNRSSKKPHLKKARLSPWLLIITAALATGLVYALIQLMRVPPEQPPASAETPQSNPRPTVKPVPQNESRPAGETYDFYTLLPKSEVIPPKVEAYTYKKAEPSTGHYQYKLQAGSFRSESEADRLRAKLILEGLNASMSKVTNKNGEVWHRVIVGPFTSRSKLNQAQDILAASNTESMLIKIKP